MMYSLGRTVRTSIYGSSHGRSVGCILEGLPAGVMISNDAIKKDLDLRRPSDGIGTKRKESDEFSILSGMINGKTDGVPILIDIPNSNVDTAGYDVYRTTPRPGHADMLANLRSIDQGIFSGRLTAPIVAAGSIAKQFLYAKGVLLSVFTRSIGNVRDDSDADDIDIAVSRKYATRALSERMDSAMRSEILKAADDGDSVGGVAECHVCGLPAGFGGLWFDSIESELSKGMFGIPGVKGIEFGEGFQLSNKRGSASNDPFFFDGTEIRTRTNRMGGVLGGMSTGMPLVFRVAFKPTPSIYKEQETVDLVSRKNTKITISGRHDPCIVPRAVSVVEAVAALVLADMAVRQ